MIYSKTYIHVVQLQCIVVYARMENVNANWFLQRVLGNLCEGIQTISFQPHPFFYLFTAGSFSCRFLFCSRRRTGESSLLTLVDVQEGLAESAGEDGFRQVSEELLHQVGHVEGRLTAVGNSIRVRLHQLPQELDPGFHSGFPEKTHLDRNRSVWFSRSGTTFSG